MKTPRSSSFAFATERIASVNFCPMFSDTANASPQRLPSGILNRCSPRARKIAFSFSVKERPCCLSCSAIASSASFSHWSRCGLHAFRHTLTALLLDTGATPKVVQRQLRHTDARTTLGIYGHVVGDAHREALEKVASKVKLDANGHQPTIIN